MFAAACAAPAPKTAPLVNLRVCVENEAQVESWRKAFVAAAAVEPREGRDCDLVAKSTTMNAGRVSLRSAYDGSLLGEIEGPVDLVPRLAALTVAPGTEPSERLAAQRKASGFGR